jgi:hypothetical protein
MMTGEIPSEALEHLHMTACHHIPNDNTVRFTDLILSMRSCDDNWHFVLSTDLAKQWPAAAAPWVSKMKDFIV